VDSTVQTHPSSHQRQFRFSMEAFKFIGMHDQVKTRAGDSERLGEISEGFNEEVIS